MADLLAPVGDIPAEGCLETQLVGFANYCRVDYRGNDCQRVVGSRNFGNHDYFGSHNYSVVHRNCHTVILAVAVVMLMTVPMIICLV